MGIENPMQLTGRRIMVTGASSGIGRETAVVLAGLGARLVLVGRDETRLANTLQQLGGDGHAVEAFDLARPEQINGWFRQLVERGGPFHGIAHCAGVQQFLPLRVLAADAMEEMYRVNMVSAAMLARAFQQRGCFELPASIVFASSTAALIAAPTNAAYGATKAALLAFVRSCAKEMADKQIRINCVVPGLVETEMVQRSRDLMTPEAFAGMISRQLLGLGRPRDVAYSIAFLLADTGRWITGSGLVIDGGLMAG